LIVGGSEHAKVKNATDRRNETKIFLSSSTGFFIILLYLKINAGKIFAIKNTLQDAINTFLSFHQSYYTQVCPGWTFLQSKSPCPPVAMKSLKG